MQSYRFSVASTLIDPARRERQERLLRLGYLAPEFKQSLSLLEKTMADMGQAIAVADNYAYSSLVWGLYVETVEGPAHGRPVNRNRVEAATKTASTCLCALEDLAPKDPWLAGPDFSLADLHAFPYWYADTIATLHENGAN